VLTIVEGNIEKVKAEMKQIAKWKADEIKKVKSQIKSWKDLEKKAAKEEKRKENAYPKELDKKLAVLEEKKALYSSKKVPVQVGQLLIDWSTYQKAMTKLKGFEIDIRLNISDIRLGYKKDKASGSVYLYDLSKLYVELKNIPIAEIKGNG
jgi:hypothetical protein